MEDASNDRPKLTIGIDVGDRFSRYCVLDEDGAIVEEDSLMTCTPGFEVDFGKRDRARIAIEAGTHSPWISRLLDGYGHQVFVANPRKLRLIYESDTKNDKLDARSLARVARLDPELLAPIEHRGEQAQADLAIIRARNAMLAARTQLINHVRGSVKSMGGRMPASSAEAFPKLAKHIPKQLWPALSPPIDRIAALTADIRKYDRQLEQIADTRYPETKRVRQPKGVGPVTSLAFVLTVEDPTRFAKSRQIGAYLGLRPRLQDSGKKQSQLRITKAGDVYMRRLLVGCAQYILGPFGEDSDLRRWGLELAKRGGKNAKKRATVAVARKLAVLMHRLWISGEAYEPLRNAGRRTKRQAATAAV